MKKRRTKQAAIEARQFYLYISPWIIVFLLFTIVPMAFSFVMSFFSLKLTTLTTRPMEFVKFDNYIRIFTSDTRFQRSILNTLLYAFGRVFFGTLLALLLALLLNVKIKGRKVFRTLIYSPAVIPIVGSTLLWKLMIFQDHSIINFLLTSVGLSNVNFLSPRLALATVTAINIWAGLGPTMLILLAGLQDVPQDLLDAADLDGANAFVKFFHIILPMLSQSLFFVLTTGLIGAFQVYAEVKLLVGDNSETVTMTMQVQQNAFATDGYSLGYASAQGWIVFAITLVFTAVFFGVTKGRRYRGGE